MTEALALGSALFIGLALRALPCTGGPRLGVDAGTHYMIAEDIRRCGRVPDRLSIYILDRRFDYPPLFHVILSTIPPRVLRRLGHCINPALDTLGLLATGALALGLGYGILPAAVAVLVYALDPVRFGENQHVTARVLSMLLMTAAALLMSAGCVTDDLVWFGAAAALLAVLLLMHKMGPQAFLAVAVAQALAFGTAKPLAVVVLGMGLALLLSRGRYALILKGHISFLRWMARHRGEYLRGQLATIRGEPPVQRQSARRFARILIMSVLGWANPWVLAGTVAYLCWDGPRDSWALSGSAWVFGLWVTSIVTREDSRGAFAGEGFRYLGYATVPVALLIARAFASNPGIEAPRYALAWAALLVAALMSVRRIVRLLAQLRSRTDPYNKDLMAVCRQLVDAGVKRVWALPHELSTPVAYLTHAAVLATISGQGLADADDLWPQLTVTPAEAMERYSVEALLLDESSVKPEEIGVSGWPVIASAGHYVVRGLVALGGQR